MSRTLSLCAGLVLVSTLTGFSATASGQSDPFAGVDPSVTEVPGTRQYYYPRVFQRNWYGAKSRKQVSFGTTICSRMKDAETDLPILVSCGAGFESSWVVNRTFGASIEAGLRSPVSLSYEHSNGETSTSQITSGECETCTGYECLHGTTVVREHISYFWGLYSTSVEFTPTSKEIRRNCVTTNQLCGCEETDRQPNDALIGPTPDDGEPKMRTVTFPIDSIIRTDGDSPLSFSDMTQEERFFIALSAQVDAEEHPAELLQVVLDCPTGIDLTFSLDSVNPLLAHSPYDLDQNGIVDGMDVEFAFQLLDLGFETVVDFNADGGVDAADLDLLLSNFGEYESLQIPTEG